MDLQGLRLVIALKISHDVFIPQKALPSVIWEFNEVHVDGIKIAKESLGNLTLLLCKV